MHVAVFVTYSKINFFQQNTLKLFMTGSISKVHKIIKKLNNYSNCDLYRFREFSCKIIFFLSYRKNISKMYEFP